MAHLHGNHAGTIGSSAGGTGRFEHSGSAVRRRGTAAAAVLMLVVGSLAAFGQSARGGSTFALASPSAVASAFALATPNSAQSVASDFLLTAQQAKALAGERSQFKAVIAECDTQLSTPPHPVTRLGLADHYNASGTNSASTTADTLAPDAQAAYRAALCYLVTGDARYASHSQSIVNAWAATLTSVSTLQGKDAINFDMPYMVGAATWVRQANGWNSAPFEAFLHNVVLPNTEISNPNNHGMWAVLLDASIATFTGDGALLNTAQTRWQQILHGEVSEDGTMPREAERSDTSNYRDGPDEGIKGIAYTHYTLLPASIAAKIFSDAGQPVWTSPGGKLLQLAFTKAAEWTLNPQSFPYYHGATANLIGVNNASYFPLLLNYYPNTDAGQVVASGKITADGFKLTTLFAT